MAVAGRRTLVLGGLGFIGSNLAFRLADRGAEVTLVDSMLPQYGGNLRNVEGLEGKVRINFSDIRDEHSLAYLVRGADVIYSLAGQTSHIESMSDPMTDLAINCQSQLSLLEACRAHNRDVTIVYASTRQLYGRPRYLPVDEKHPVEPVDVNGVNKLAAEMYYGLYSRVHGMKCVSLRLTNTYGPRQQLRGNSQGFVGIFLRLALQGKPLKVFGDGKQVRDFNYVDDVVDALLLAGDEPRLQGGSFNLGADERWSLLEFVESLRRAAPVDFTLVPFPPEHKSIDIGDYWSDDRLFRSLTGWRPKVGLDEGLRRTVEWFRPRLKDYE
jgi:UDP-glucose 4-epimerase